MKVLVCGAGGCVGNAVVQALRSRGHRVIEGGRALQDGRATIHIDFAQPREPVQWAKALTVLQVEAVVNCAGILIETRSERFERVHSAGPIELFRGAALAGVRRIVQVSALGVGSDPASLATPYLHSKLPGAARSPCSRCMCSRSPKQWPAWWKTRAAPAACLRWAARCR